MLLLLVLGLVIVVPKLAWRECPRLNGVTGGDCVTGVTGTLDEDIPGGAAVPKLAPSRIGPMPLSEKGWGTSSIGVLGNVTSAFPSSESASTSSGGSRSFSISDFRLKAQYFY
jgi:hypothetical protein